MRMKKEGTIRRIALYFTSYGKDIFIIVVSLLLIALGTFTLPILIGKITDQGMVEKT